ncbi:MAG: three-Cys-motif partner protein TcmP [Polyangiaceae bacterium]
MATEQFFTESSEASRVKATIVSKYFMAWAKVVMATAKKHGRKLGYIDLFAGPGRYEDGTKSTPLMILEQAVADPEIAEMLVTQFNDQNPEHASSLLDAIQEIPGIDKLRFEPKVDNLQVDGALATQLEESRLIPTFAFADPWGYKGLSLRLISALVKDWGCDCVFFFNYNRINMGVANDTVREHIDALFGPERGAALREKLKGLDADQREKTILEELARALKELAGRYVLPFRFRSETGRRTSHHLFFVTKHPKGFEIIVSAHVG